jgi:hypothetical protein
MFTWQGSRSAVVALVVLSLFALSLSGCGGEEPRSQATPTVRARPVVEQPLPTATEPSALSRRDVPPSGVAAQLSYRAAQAASDACLETFTDETYNASVPSVKLSGCSRVPSRCTVCFLNFDPNQDIMFHLFGPEGELFQSRVQPDAGGDAGREWRIDPRYHEVGEYQVYAVQAGAVRGWAKFTVQQATAPTILLPRSQVRPGLPLEVILAAFQPGQRVALHLYRHDLQRGWVYLTSLPPAQMDDRGQNLDYTVNIQSGDPAGDYQLVTEPTSAGIARFRVGN